MVTNLLFDLDETLYASGTGLWDAIRDRMTGYMLERLHLPPDQVPGLRRRYYETYGTTLRGLQIHHQVDSDDYLAYVHDLPLHEYLCPDPALRSLLLTLPQRCWIFTNADEAHARRVLAELKLEGCFDGIIDVRALSFACKPEPEAYRRALELTGESQPGKVIMFDDSAHNLEPAHELGIVTVLVGGQTPHPAADYVIPSLLDLPRALPFLWSRSS